MSNLLVNFEKEKENRGKDEISSIDHEIECPRCHDIMTLYSEFDRLGYRCEECDFSLRMIH